jgi:hypothetical protein
MHLMFRHHYGAKMEELAEHGDISEVTKAAREALNAGCPFYQIVYVLKSKGFLVKGDKDVFTVTPLFDAYDIDLDALPK